MSIYDTVYTVCAHSETDTHKTTKNVVDHQILIPINSPETPTVGTIYNYSIKDLCFGLPIIYNKAIKYTVKHRGF